jgi:hypothetical protein
MDLMDLLGHYARHPNQPPPHVFDDFDRVAQEAPPEEISHGLEEAFRSDATPPFEQMVGQLYERSDPQQRAGLLQEILASLGGGMAGGAAGGALGDILRNVVRGNRVSPEEARQIPAEKVEAATREAADRNPSLIERVSRFYAQPPQLVHTLWQAALGIALTQMARRRKM